jgi:hypothetical protein
MSNINHAIRSFSLVLTITVLAGNGSAHAVTATGPSVNLFNAATIESLSNTSKTARALESSLEKVINQLETQAALYESADCALSNDAGCVQLRKGVKKNYAELLNQIQEQLPEIKRNIAETRDALGEQMASELGRKMSPGDLQRLLAGRHGKMTPSSPALGKAKTGRLSGLFEGYYNLVRRGGNSSGNSAVLASQLYIDAVHSANYLGLIGAEIDSQHTELLLELEWGELTAQMTGTVDNVKQLLWGSEEMRQDILNVGLQNGQPQEAFADLYVD